MIRIRSRSPQVSSAVSQSKGYRQLCSLWFEYDLCLNRKPPSDHKFGITPIKRVPTAMFSLVNTPMFEHEAPKWPLEQGTYVWTAHHGSKFSLATFNFSSNLREMESSWTGILNRILRASKLCERQISLEPDFKPEFFILSRRYSDGL